MQANPSPLRVMAVSTSEEDHDFLRRMLREFQCEMQSAYTRAEAVDIMRAEPVPVIISDRDLPDGTWRDILDESARQANPSYVIVTSQLAYDAHLWCEVLHFGGDDVLATPFEPTEVAHRISTGWCRWDAMSGVPNHVLTAVT